MKTNPIAEPDARAIVDALRARKAGNGWSARCPAHDDSNPSLSLTFRDGKLLVHCHAGCTQDNVLTALRARGLWSSSSRPGDHPPEWGVIVETYEYVDEQGRSLYQVCRFVPKTFRPRRPCAGGNWRWGYGQVRRVLYRLPEVLKATIVFVTEGEKDAERLRDYGFIATTNAGGADAEWLPDYTAALRGREVILVPDNDPPGRLRVLRIARALWRDAARLSILELPGAKDVSEWFDMGRSELELIHSLEAEYAN